MKVAVIQLAYDDAEPIGERRERVAELVRMQRGHDLVMLPELWGATGFDYQKWEASAEPLYGPTVELLAGVARDIGSMVHLGSIIERLPEPGVEGRHLANTSVVLSPAGEPVAAYRKIHRFGFGAGEPKLLEAGGEIVTVGLPGGHTAGLSTCYDLRFPELYRRQLDAGAEVFLVPAAWPKRRVEHWSLLGRARAVENQCAFIACNTAGTHGGYEMGGHSQVVAATGEVLAEAGLDEAVLSVDLDLGAVARWREEFPVLADRRL